MQWIFADAEELLHWPEPQLKKYGSAHGGVSNFPCYRRSLCTDTLSIGYSLCAIVNRNQGDDSFSFSGHWLLLQQKSYLSSGSSVSRGKRTNIHSTPLMPGHGPRSGREGSVYVTGKETSAQEGPKSHSLAGGTAETGQLCESSRQAPTGSVALGQPLPAPPCGRQRSLEQAHAGCTPQTSPLEPTAQWMAGGSLSSLLLI